jgi:hypothetical protein
MSKTVRIAPPNSLLFVSDQKWGDPIDFKIIKPIMWNRTSVAICCLMSQDGETEVTLGSADEVNPGWPPAFDDVITASRSVVVSTSERMILLEYPVQTSHSKITVWTNREKEPDRVVIGVG